MPDEKSTVVNGNVNGVLFAAGISASVIIKFKKTAAVPEFRKNRTACGCGVYMRVWM